MAIMYLTYMLSNSTVFFQFPSRFGTLAYTNMHKNNKKENLIFKKFRLQVVNFVKMVIKPFGRIRIFFKTLKGEKSPNIHQFRSK